MFFFSHQLHAHDYRGPWAFMLSAYIIPVDSLDNKTGCMNDYWAKYSKWTAQIRCSRLQAMDLKFVTWAMYSHPAVTYLFEWVWGRFYYFSFIFILTESLKNHSKSQKNHKIENPNLLDSTWLDIHS